MFTMFTMFIVGDVSISLTEQRTDRVTKVAGVFRAGRDAAGYG
jgi:hypothetical protein